MPVSKFVQPNFIGSGFVTPKFVARPASAAGKVLTFGGNRTDNTNATLYTFASCNIGTAAADRYVIVGVTHSNSTTAPVSVTVNAVTATHIIGVDCGGSLRLDLYIALVTSGTSVDIVVDPASVARCAIGWWYATGLSSGTPVDSDTSTAAPSTATLTTVSGGFMIAVCANNVNTSGMTWSGTGVNERWDDIYEANYGLSGADAATTGADISPSCAHDSAETARGGVFATF